MISTKKDTFFDDIKGLELGMESQFNTARGPITSKAQDDKKAQFFAENKIADTSEQKKSNEKVVKNKREDFIKGINNY